MNNRQFELRSKGIDKIILSEYLGNGVTNEIIEIEGTLGTVSIGNTTFSVIFDDFFFFYSFNIEDETYENWFSDGSTINTLDSTLNFGYLRKKMEIEERVLASIRTYNGKSFYYNVKKDEILLDTPTVIDSSSQINFDLCTQAISTNTENVLSDDNKIRLFPNPASNHITISSEAGERINLKILDSQGRIIMTDISFKQEHIVSLENVMTGIYFVHITLENSDFIYTKKFVKQ